MLQGCVEIRNGPMEIILGGGPGTNGQVADPFQKFGDALLQIRSVSWPRTNTNGHDSMI